MQINHSYLIFHTQLAPHQSFTISFLFPAFPYAIFTFLLLLVGRSWHVGLSGPLILLAFKPGFGNTGTPNPGGKGTDPKAIALYWRSSVPVASNAPNPPNPSLAPLASWSGTYHWLVRHRCPHGVSCLHAMRPDDCDDQTTVAQTGHVCAWHRVSLLTMLSLT